MNDVHLRDYFAATCPENEVADRMPKTIGGIRDRLIELNRIPNIQVQSVVGSYSDSDVQWLRAMIRYQYADDMLRARMNSLRKGV